MKPKNISLFSIKKNPTTIQAVKITSSNAASEFLRQFFDDDLLVSESFHILTLNKANISTGVSCISRGGIDACLVDVKMLAKICLDSLCNGVILCHNHPSGQLKASEADIKITNKIKDALKLLDIIVLDHIILTETNYYSFSDEGIL
jgi:DNA repair protein RadC